MNERIEKIAKQAGYIPVPGFDFANSLEETFIKKFAELIIQDCIDCVEGYTKPRTFNTHYDAVEQIKANFGVE